MPVHPHPVEPAVAHAIVEFAAATAHGLLVLDAHGVVLHANAAAAALLGVSVDDLLGDRLRAGERFCYADGTALEGTELPSAIVTRTAVDRAEAMVGIRDPGSESPSVWVQIEAHRASIGGRRCAVSMLVDVSDRFATRSELKGILDTLQHSLVPESVSTIEGVDIAARYRAAEGLLTVGGDFYDTVVVDEAAIDFFIGDVQGHGVAAASLTSVARHTLRAAALDSTDAPTAMRWLHRALKANPSERACSAAFGCVSRLGDGSLEVSYCLGGHPPPLVLVDGEATTFHGEHGTVLGIVDVDEFPDNTIELRPGMAMVFYTDGLTDARAPRLTEKELLAAAAWTGSAASTADALMAFGRDDPTRSDVLTDDTAVFVIAPLMGKADNDARPTRATRPLPT